MFSSEKIRQVALLTVAVVLAIPQTVLAQPNPCGIWEVDGKDDSGTTWAATLVLEPEDKDEYPP